MTRKAEAMRCKTASLPLYIIFEEYLFNLKTPLP